MIDRRTASSESKTRNDATVPSAPLSQQLHEKQSLMSQRAKMSVAAQFKAIGQNQHPLGLSGLKTRSGMPATKTQKITQKIIHNYEQVILQLSNEQKKQGKTSSESPNGFKDNNKQIPDSPVKDFSNIIEQDLNDDGLKLVNSVNSLSKVSDHHVKSDKDIQSSAPKNICLDKQVKNKTSIIVDDS